MGTACKSVGEPLGGLGVGTALQQQASPPLHPLAIFWDIENCAVPHQKSAFTIAQFLRSEFRHLGSEVDFVVVCDVTKESPEILNDLNLAQVTVVHVSATCKNAADEKLKHFLRKFHDMYKPPGSVILISSDVNFAPELYELNFRHGFHVVVIHDVRVSKGLLGCAHDHHLYRDLIQRMPGKHKWAAKHTDVGQLGSANIVIRHFVSADVAKFLVCRHILVNDIVFRYVKNLENFGVSANGLYFYLASGSEAEASVLGDRSVVVDGLPRNVRASSIRGRLRRLTDNCGGRVRALNMNSCSALICFATPNAASRAKYRLSGADVHGHRIEAELVSDRTHQSNSDWVPPPFLQQPPPPPPQYTEWYPQEVTPQPPLTDFVEYYPSPPPSETRIPILGRKPLSSNQSPSSAPGNSTNQRIRAGPSSSDQDREASQEKSQSVSSLSYSSDIEDSDNQPAMNLLVDNFKSVMSFEGGTSGSGYYGSSSYATGGLRMAAGNAGRRAPRRRSSTSHSARRQDATFAAVSTQDAFTPVRVHTRLRGFGFPFSSASVGRGNSHSRN